MLTQFRRSIRRGILTPTCSKWAKKKTGLHPDIAGPANYDDKCSHAGTLPDFAGPATQRARSHCRGDGILPALDEATTNVLSRCKVHRPAQLAQAGAI